MSRSECAGFLMSSTSFTGPFFRGGCRAIILPDSGSPGEDASRAANAGRTDRRGENPMAHGRSMPILAWILIAATVVVAAEPAPAGLAPERKQQLERELKEIRAL